VEPESSRRVFEGRLVKLDVEQWPAGEREVVKHPGACAIVAITPEGEVLLVRQFREAVRRELLEIPAGVIEEGESPEACAARELLEETGYRATRLEHLGTIYTSPGFTNERIAIFRAEAEPNKPPEEEGVSVEKIPLSRLAALLFDGADLDSKTVVGLFLATDASRNRR